MVIKLSLTLTTPYLRYHFACNHWLSLPGTPGRKSYRKLAVSETGAVDPLLPARVSASLAVIPSAENAGDY